MDENKTVCDKNILGEYEVIMSPTISSKFDIYSCAK